MRPYLTSQGKWLFASAVVFVLVGAAISQPLMVLFGQIPLVVLLASVVSMLPAARSLDRRCTAFEIDSETVSGAIVHASAGDEQKLKVWVENGGPARLRIRRLMPFVSGPMDVEISQLPLAVDSGRAARFGIEIQATGVGRASLQGFDVEILDRLGLVAARDYLPCIQIVESHAPVGRFRRRVERRRASIAGSPREQVHSSREGMTMRELRDFQPGDPLRAIAWKATARQRRLIARQFDDERTRCEYIGLDISSSMRAGKPRGQKFDHAIEIAAGLADMHLEGGRKVGLWTYDEAVYGEVAEDRGGRHLRRIQRHLAALRSVVDARRTALSDDELEQALADYLLVQERLDFRHGQGLEGEVDGRLLRSWLASTVERESRRWNEGGDSPGVIDDSSSLVRRFFRLRGLQLDPPAEVRPGTKVLGLREVIQRIVTRRRSGGRVTLITDLCGVSEVEILESSISLARRRGFTLCVLAPFTPYYTGRGGAFSNRARVVRTLFSRAEKQERDEVARKLAALGVEVRFVGPSSFGESASS